MACYNVPRVMKEEGYVKENLQFLQFFLGRTLGSFTPPLLEPSLQLLSPYIVSSHHVPVQDLQGVTCVSSVPSAL